MDFLELEDDFLQPAYRESYLERENAMSEKERGYLQKIENYIQQHVSPEIYDKYFRYMALFLFSDKYCKNIIQIETGGGEMLYHVRSHQDLIIKAMDENDIPYEKLHITWYYKEYVPFRV